MLSFQNNLDLLKVEGCIVRYSLEDWALLTDISVELLNWIMHISVVLSNPTLVFKLLLRILRTLVQIVFYTFYSYKDIPSLWTTG